MDKVTALQSVKTVEGEACAWIAQLDGGNPSPEDLAALREWIARSPVHRQTLERLAALWDETNILTELAVPRSSPKKSQLTPASKSEFRQRFWPKMAIALSIAAIGVVSSWPWLFEKRLADAGTDLATRAPTISQGVFATGIGEQETVKLQDGSRVILNTNSQIEVDFRANRRDIRLLKGEAHFAVAHDPRAPFRVFARTGLVRAVGTAFTVYLKDTEDVSVTVSDGQVELATGTVDQGNFSANRLREVPAVPLVRLRAGQIATFGDDIETIKSVDADEIRRQLSWRTGLLHFDGEPLSEVLREVSRYTTDEIVIIEPSLRNLRIGGYFRVGETEALLEALESGFDIGVERIGANRIELRARH